MYRHIDREIDRQMQNKDRRCRIKTKVRSLRQINKIEILNAQKCALASREEDLGKD